MALKREYTEVCSGCGAHVAHATNEGVKLSPSACSCDKPPGPQDPPRTIPWRSAALIGNDGKAKWVHSTIFLALQADVWQEATIHEVQITKGQWYWLDETWSIGGKGCGSMLEAEEAQRQYAGRL